MRVQNIQNQKYLQPNFNAWRREVIIPLSKVEGRYSVNRNDTWIYRDKPDWHYFTNFIVRRFKDVPKVNVYNYGCSNGSEAYTFIMEMLSHFDSETAQKFFPVVAKDIDPVAIEEAKKYLHDLREEEILDINRNTIYQFDSFFEETDKPGLFGNLYKPTKLLTDNVKFSLANIIKDFKNIEPNNSIVFARNFWPYLEEKQRVELAQKLHKQLGENSLLVYGDFDRIGTAYNNGSCIADLFKQCGFKPTEICFTLEKDPSFVQKTSIWE